MNLRRSIVSLRLKILYIFNLKIRRILYSSIITDELRHKGESVGADYQVSKPDMNQMAEMAIKLIEGRQANTEN